MIIKYEWTTPCIAFKKTLVPGIYLFEVWGAQGGSSTSINVGGKGGYAKGEILLKNETTVFVHVGGHSQTADGGCNGGGSAVAAKTAGGGGTDIRINTDSLYSRVIVAGGGGGSGIDDDHGVEIGGFGGGLRGGDGVYFSPSWTGIGATENGPGKTCADGINTSCAAGSFGSGGNSSSCGGGGGGWYGGASSKGSDPGGGGSGFVFVENAKLPSEYLLGSEYYLSNANLRAGNTSIPSFDSPSVNVTGNSGNGAVRISVLAHIIYKRTYKCFTPKRMNKTSLIALFFISLCVAPFDGFSVSFTKN